MVMSIMGILLINPQRASAARVTVLALCVCLSVCLSASNLASRATVPLKNDTAYLADED